MKLRHINVMVPKKKKKGIRGKENKKEKKAKKEPV